METLKNSALILFLSGLVFSCKNEEQQKEHSSTSWEIIGTDTCNLTVNGLRQGKWYIYDLSSGSRTIKDTFFYKDGEKISGH